MKISIFFWMTRNVINSKIKKRKMWPVEYKVKKVKRIWTELFTFLLMRWEDVITHDSEAVDSPYFVVKVWYFDERNFAIASNDLQLI